MTKPYRTTPIFDAQSLPDALRREHRTKAGAWGIVRVLEGKLLLHLPGRLTQELSADSPGLIAPQETHWVEPVGPMRMQVEFYSEQPALTRN
ncbi:DUF1971 domain-containing protein [Sphingomonas sp. HDW15A]|uniref:DUF1971 domain-containing protein n=1 Tax=Sphingomonas sp. HDW15A TaxID=2714942 RepID=UPI0014083908|nr:DUF1971 domain-containing protein [Sphingomonas sp. HDW15A]QIK96249.1 DUF1971 domain-containing protein [Sphingomonas sp. HDW15A]